MLAHARPTMFYIRLVILTSNVCVNCTIIDLSFEQFRHKFRTGRAKLTTSGAHDVIAITSPQENDLCTEELQDSAQLVKSLDEVSRPLRKARFGCLFL